MTIEALNIAARGLIESERRANDLASRIVNAGADAAGFEDNLNALTEGQETPNRAAIETAAAQSTGRPVGAGATSLIQDSVDLIAEKNNFKASAAAFKAADELSKELTNLFDEES